MSNRPVNVKGAVRGTPVDLADLQSEYDRLLGSLGELTHVRRVLEADPAAADRALEKRRQHIQDQLHAVAKRIADKDAHTLSAVAVKARVLLDWCEHDRDDIVSQLTMSLCRDVLRAAKSDSSDQSVPGR
jgi:hypothetical protein